MKAGKGTKTYVQIAVKQQSGRFNPNHINNYINGIYTHFT